MIDILNTYVKYTAKYLTQWLNSCRTYCGLPSILIVLAVVLLLCWHWWSTQVLVLIVHQDSPVNIPIKSTPPPLSSSPKAEVNSVRVQKVTPRPTDLVDLLSSLSFKNYGIAKSSDVYVFNDLPCIYLEAQNVTSSYTSWSDTYGESSYLYQSVAGILVHPPSGMRSSVPLGGEDNSWGVIRILGSVPLGKVSNAPLPPPPPPPS